MKTNRERERRTSAVCFIRRQQRRTGKNLPKQMATRLYSISSERLCEHIRQEVISLNGRGISLSLPRRFTRSLKCSFGQRKRNCRQLSFLCCHSLVHLIRSVCLFVHLSSACSSSSAYCLSFIHLFFSIEWQRDELFSDFVH